jgi:ATP-binding cassette subfamily B protein
VLLATRGLLRMIRSAHRRMRERGSSVTGLIADLFGGVLALQTAGAEGRALARFQAANASRRHAAVRAQLAVNLMQTVSGASAQVTTGLVLILAAGAMRQGSFTVGDLALFTAYAGTLTNLPRWLGGMMTNHREADVALGRLARLHRDRRTEHVVARRPEPAPPEPAPDLRRLEVRGLTARHPGTEAGVFDVDLTVEAGTLTVVTGPVGSGKTTLLRALLGLLPVEAGDVRWNGVPVADPGAFLVPPRVAYAGQVARLFSAPLRENLALGWPAGEDDLWAALGTAQLTDDVGGMPSGLATVVGARGSRLSGGQLQRAAVARAVVRRPDLLVLDDVSSALDHSTEERLWAALAEGGLACLVASHRPAALARADRIIVLDAGRVAAVQSLPLASRHAATAVSPSAGSGSYASSTEREVGPANERA